MAAAMPNDMCWCESLRVVALLVSHSFRSRRASIAVAMFPRRRWSRSCVVRVVEKASTTSEDEGGCLDLLAVYACGGSLVKTRLMLSQMNEML